MDNLIQKNERRSAALEVFDWNDKRKEEMWEVLHPEYVSSEEEGEAEGSNPPYRKKRKIEWGSKKLKDRKKKPDHIWMSKLATKKQIRYKVAVREGHLVSERPQPCDAPKLTITKNK